MSCPLDACAAWSITFCLHRPSSIFPRFSRENTRCSTSTWFYDPCDFSLLEQPLLYRHLSLGIFAADQSRSFRALQHHAPDPDAVDHGFGNTCVEQLDTTGFAGGCH